MSVYFGRNFKTIVREDKTPGFAKLRDIQKWCVILNNMTLIHGTSGEISFRTPQGFAITAAKARLTRLLENQLVEVLEYNRLENALYVRGTKEPSSQALLHYVIYQKRPDVNAIFHIYDSTMMNARSDLDIPLIAESNPMEIIRTLGNHDAIAIKRNGILFLGPTMDQAGDLIVQKHTQEFRMRLGRTF